MCIKEMTSIALEYYKTAALQSTQRPRPKPRFVPKVVYLPKEVTGDFPFNNICARPGSYDAYVNPFGAVKIETPNGWLGLKLHEFSVYEWTENSHFEEVPHG